MYDLIGVCHGVRYRRVCVFIERGDQGTEMARENIYEVIEKVKQLADEKKRLKQMEEENQ